MTTLDILIGARKLLVENKGWTQHQYARKTNNVPCLYSDKTAACFCLEGAIAHVRGALLPQKSDELKALGFQYGEELIEWNDTRGRTKEEVIARLDTAIAKLSAASGDAGNGGGV